MKRGTLYRSGDTAGEVSITAIVKYLKRLARSLRWSGWTLIVLAVSGLAVIYGPLAEVEVRYALNLQQKKAQPVSKFGDILEEWPSWQVPNPEYSLYIPKIDALAQVIPGVDAADEQAYLEALKKGVAAAAGMGTPGTKSTTYLFAHSTDSPINFARYNAVFYLLDKVKPGEKVEVVYRNKLYKYTVTSSEILPADDVRYLVPQNDEEKLVLQTCYPPGTTWKRLVVVAKRI